jgi:hypothetical protein
MKLFHTPGGNNAEKRPIYVDGHKLEIMPSLDSALRHLRYERGDDRGEQSVVGRCCMSPSRTRDRLLRLACPVLEIRRL